MNAVSHLASLLSPAVQFAGLPMARAGDIDAVIETLQQRAKAGSTAHVPVDLQHQALQQFWQSPAFQTLGAARLVCFGLGVSAGPVGSCLFDDAARLAAVLAGVDAWLSQPRAYRRCYQGLLRSYFGFDPEAEGVSPIARANWLRLRGYLKAHAPKTLAGPSNPRWAEAAQDPALFGDAPAARYAADLLRGDRDEVEQLCDTLGIDGASWFRRRLAEAQIDAATQFADEAFRAALPALIELLSSTPALRDRGLAMLLERHAALPPAPMHEGLRDAAAAWWGTPWAMSTAWHWQAVGDATCALAADALKAHLIESFFRLQSGGGSRRRADFWLRYLAATRSVEFAFGAAAKTGSLAHVRGLGTPLHDAAGDIAMVLTIGSAVVVTFLDPDEALFGYDLRQGRQFDLERPVALARDADNSLRLARRDLELTHRDGVNGWRQWEQMFEAALKDRFDLRTGARTTAAARPFIDLSDDDALRAGLPSARPPHGPNWVQPSAGEDVHWQTAEAASVPYSRPDLEVLARVHALRIEDLTVQQNRLWVRSEPADSRLQQVLRRWGFTWVAGAGWWK